MRFKINSSVKRDHYIKIEKSRFLNCIGTFVGMYVTVFFKSTMLFSYFILTFIKLSWNSVKSHNHNEIAKIFSTGYIDVISWTNGLIDKYRLDRQHGIQAEFRIVGIKFFSPVRSAFRGSRHKRTERGERIPPFPTVFRHTAEILAGKIRFFSSALFVSVIWFTPRDVVVVDGEEKGGEKAVGPNPSSAMLYYNNFLWK